LDKRYLTDVDLTATTSTGDLDGDRLEEHTSLSSDELDAALAGLRGEIELPIPAVSAVRVGGERAYKLARRGVVVEMPRRRSQVHALDVIAYTGDSVRLALHVGSGTYVRSLAAALGGHCTSLRRTAVGPFGVEEAEAGGGERWLTVADALGRLPVDALARVAAGARERVLALEREDGGDVPGPLPGRPG
jgi:tRNA pseudouridine55 synthase